jgi:hypothetical protein
MGKVFDRIDDKLRAWISKQALFFVGTAPLGPDGHVNVSPKGPIQSLAVIDETTIAYLDIIGSGAETIAHLRENGRIVVMLCAFDGPPRILRLHGRGEIVLPDETRFDELVARCAFETPRYPDTRRAIIVVHVERVADSCGYGVPLMSYEGRRDHADAWAENKLTTGGPGVFDEYRRAKNATSIDGLPALFARRGDDDQHEGDGLVRQPPDPTRREASRAPGGVRAELAETSAIDLERRDLGG